MIDKVIVVRYIPTGYERDMLLSTYSGIKTNKAQWEYVRDKYEATPQAVEAEGVVEPTAQAAPRPKKKGCNCGKK